jgi:preprotein translocase subunit YajC
MTALAALPALLALMAPSSSNAMYQQFFIIAMLFVAMYFFMIVPQQRQRKEHEGRVNSLKRGDQVVTTGGVVGEVVHIRETMKDGAPEKTLDDVVTIKSGESRILVERRSIVRVGGAAADAKS